MKGKEIWKAAQWLSPDNVCGSHSLAVLALLLHSTSERAPKI